MIFFFPFQRGQNQDHRKKCYLPQVTHGETEDRSLQPSPHVIFLLAGKLVIEMRGLGLIYETKSLYIV